MIYKHMYCGYKNSGKIIFKNNDAVITSSAANFEDKTFVYFETKDEKLTVDDVVEGDMKLFPGGEKWFEMSEIFHYFTPANDEEWERKITDKKAIFMVNHLNQDKIASYIYYHVDHQNSNQYNCDKYMSIFIYKNIIVMYLEKPTERITWQDIEGRYHVPPRTDWEMLMNEHFKAWPNGEKKWIGIENE